MRAHISRAKLISLPSLLSCGFSYSVIFLIIRCVAKIVVYSWISLKKPGCGSEAPGLRRQTHV